MKIAGEQMKKQKETINNDNSLSAINNFKVRIRIGVRVRVSATRTPQYRHLTLSYILTYLIYSVSTSPQSPGFSVLCRVRVKFRIRVSELRV